MFDPGFAITPIYDPLGFHYGADAFGPAVENRTLDAIRKNLLDPDCSGPEIVYAIAMDVGDQADRAAMQARNLLYGAVSYASGQLGREPVRSQGHIHAVSPSCGMSTCEVYEIWSGSAYIYMQQYAADDPGRCYAVLAGPGEVVIVPPGWAHCTIVADTSRHMTFGAWCVRDYGFEYRQLRDHGGVAWFPLVEDRGQIRFVRNERYQSESCIIKKPRPYHEFGLQAGKPIYTQFQEDPDRFLFVSRPQTAAERWAHFIP